MFLGFGCAGWQTPPPVAEKVDLERYAGVWHEVARLPNSFQSRCVGPATAMYSPLPGGRLRVVNTCRDAKGRFLCSEGVAAPVPGSGNAKLKVRFGGPVAGDYWIHALDPGYQWALVGHPSRRFLWVLSRKEKMNRLLLDRLLMQAEGLGYDVRRVVRFE